jgi:hypothetical protein
MLTDTPPTSERLNAMSEREYRMYEARLRRAAKRQGLVLCKSRRRDSRAHDYGTYCLLDVRTRFQVAGDHEGGYGLSLSEIHAALVEGDA